MHGGRRAGEEETGGKHGGDGRWRQRRRKFYHKVASQSIKHINCIKKF